MEVVMKYEVSVNGREGQLRVDDSQFEYRGVARDYSMAQSGPGI